MKHFKFNRNMILFAILTMGISLTLVYIFYTSTAFLHSDSVITDCIAHQQRIHHQFILSNWYYGNEFWFFSLTIPTYLLSYVIKDNLLLRQVSVLITAIIFFIILYKYAKKFLPKEEKIFLLAIFATGISYSVLDYFYAFNAYLTVVINSMLLLYVYFKVFEEKNSKVIYYIFAIILTFIFNIGSLRYLPSVVAPFILTEFILLFIDNYKKDILKIRIDKRIIKMLVIVLVSFIALGIYFILINKYHFTTRAAVGEYIKLTTDNIIENVGAIFECIYNFFGYDNRPHSYSFMTQKEYFFNWSKNYSVYSLWGIFNFVKIIASILFMVVAPIILFKNYKKNSRNINFLLIFNTVSWAIMIYLFVFSDSFFHNYSECKYFLFNIIISIILAINCCYKYLSINKNIKLLLDAFLVIYLLSNIYQTSMVIVDHNKSIVDNRYELTKTLEENDLTFGYGNFWASLMTNFLSDYKIDVVPLTLGNNMEIDKWYVDDKILKKNYHTGRTFLVLNSFEYSEFSDIYIDECGEPDEVLTAGTYYIYVYNKNPFREILY